MKLKKAAILLLTIVLSTVSAAGCSRQERPDKAEDKGKNVAMGRYVEEEIKMPEAVMKGEEVAYLMVNNPKKGILVFSSPMKENENKTIQYTLQKDGTWKQEIPGWLNQEKYGVLCVTYQMDGTGYAVRYKDLADKIELHILKSTDGEKAVDIPIEDYKDAVGYDKLPYGISVLPDDGILLLCQDEGTLYEDGKAVSHFENNGRVYALSENTLLTVNNKADGFSLIDVTTGKTIREVPFDGDMDKVALTADKNGNWFVTSGSGIYRLAKNGTTWESVLDGNLVSLSSPNLGLNSMIAGEQEDFYVLFESGGMGKRTINHYTYNKDVVTVPDKTLTVLSLEENATVRQAIVAYQHKNPDVKVDYKVVMDKEDAATVSDHIKSINTELLAGKGPDLLIMDGLPVDSYIEKGILEDLSDILKPMSEKGELLKNIIKNYEKQDKIYYAPLRFGITFAFGSKEAVSRVKTLKGLSEYAGNKKALPLFGSGLISDADLITLMYRFYSNDFILEDGGLEKESLKQFLQQLKVIQNQAKTVEKSLWGIGQDELNMQASSLMINKETQLSLTELYNMYDVFAPIEVLKSINGTYSDINGEFVPKGLIGINGAGKQKKLAKEFVQEVYSEQVQKTELGDGFPVNKNALKEFSLEKDDFLIGDGNFEAGQPGKEEMKQILKLGENLTTPVVIDEQLFEAVRNEAEAYLKGEINLNQAVEQVMDKSKTYLNE
ncbi:ABC transporter substrate-binding protein [Anaerocolumna sp. MB42-C2]|uniref:ABC transporter substrate-binding protein n=1 Tax=Anaerocolumna sp. MB42-C2 TaxID=3070997 RepID=UPI0027E20C83|nr:ABC transporter substrate-binding protein [Anaerocolumna sp. MB42-C2]WMJ87697.1 ABC transporter substrate-binding protein [Anaerocolumna sp. MB42-C2]